MLSDVGVRMNENNRTESRPKIFQGGAYSHQPSHFSFQRFSFSPFSFNNIFYSSLKFSSHEGTFQWHINPQLAPPLFGWRNCYFLHIVGPAVVGKKKSLVYVDVLCERKKWIEENLKERSENGQWAEMENSKRETQKNLLWRRCFSLKETEREKKLQYLRFLSSFLLNKYWGKNG